MRPRLGELASTRLKLLLEFARVRLNVLFRRSLRLLRPAELTHADRPQAEGPPIRNHTTLAPPLCEADHGPGAAPFTPDAAHPWSNSEHFRCSDTPPCPT